MPFIILELGKDVSSLIWGKLDTFDRFIIVSSLKCNCDEYYWNYQKHRTPHKFIKKISESGYLDLMKWAKNNGQGYWNMFSASFAVEHGYMEILEWAKENNLDWGDFAFRCAAKRGDIKLLEWLKENGCPKETNVHSYALENKNISLEKRFEILKWLKDNKFEWTIWTFQDIVRYGNIEMLKWAYENGCPSNIWDHWAFTCAALNGDLEILKWLREKKFTWDYETFEYAALNGNCEILEWLLENNCPFNKYTYVKLLNAGKFETVKFMKEKEYPKHHKICKYIWKLSRIGESRFSHLDWIKTHLGCNCKYH